MAIVACVTLGHPRLAVNVMTYTWPSSPVLRLAILALPERYNIHMAIVACVTLGHPRLALNVITYTWPSSPVLRLAILALP